ncbi:MAG: bifunctional phosphopantothenoylcysteine decarboxylase/phosphopantothenate--cysteine ligase CoaBC [Coriobacteriia bacterium]|nr:bifunctional phosphopantothenoylcysteine decarboxylase/phosphopantothenate--cysteine ligase CoaBC [Coriobacteriia bacterium]
MSSCHPQPTVLLGVTGCIAAYKACELVRILQKQDVQVKVVMTPAGAEFVTPATFRALTRQEVALAPIDDPHAPIHHISLAQEASVFVIAPATANTINKLAAGIADNLLTTTALATEAPLLIAPAMNVHMWRDENTQLSLAQLRERGAQIIEPEEGYLACGEIGEGRLAPVEEIAAAVLAELNRSQDLTGRKLLVTAGPTREYLDPARFLSNASSGITGYTIAEEAARRGAQVTLISGPTTLPDPFGCTTIRVTSAQQMLEQAQEAFTAHGGLDAAIFTAAVGDYRPEQAQQQKMKKAATGSATELQLVANPDILATLAANKGSAYIVGFAAETQDIIAEARKKLHQKQADLIVANDISDPSIGFASAHNCWHLVTAEHTESTGLLPKKALARLLVDRIVKEIQ